MRDRRDEPTHIPSENQVVIGDPSKACPIDFLKSRLVLKFFLEKEQNVHHLCNTPQDHH